MAGSDPNDVLVRADLGEQVADLIKRLILSGEFVAGQRLVEADLARRFGTSRGPVRDALGLLARRGLVTARPHRGCVVRRLTVRDIREVYSLRRALEGLALEEIVRSGDREAVVDDLRHCLDALDAARSTAGRLEVGMADMALHREIVRRSEHRRLLDAWDVLADETLLMMTELSSLDPLPFGSAGDHRELVEAIALGDAASATAALDAHLRAAEATIVSSTAPEAGNPQLMSDPRLVSRSPQNP